MFYNIRMADKNWPEYYAKNRERILERRKQRYLENREKELRQAKEYREKHPEVAKATQKRHKLKNRERLRLHYRRQKAIVVEAYGGGCVCCGETLFEFLTIDHINGGGRQDRAKRMGSMFYVWLRKNGFPKEHYRLLCMNCNFSYGMYGYCPHQKIATAAVPTDAAAAMEVEVVEEPPAQA